MSGGILYTFLGPWHHSASSSPFACAVTVSLRRAEGGQHHDDQKRGGTFVLLVLLSFLLPLREFLLHELAEKEVGVLVVDLIDSSSKAVGQKGRREGGREGWVGGWMDGVEEGERGRGREGGKDRWMDRGREGGRESERGRRESRCRRRTGIRRKERLCMGRFQ
eukprot:518782-Hanusia_phi.AAC.1